MVFLFVSPKSNAFVQIQRFFFPENRPLLCQMRIVLFIILSSSLIELHLIYVFPVSDCQRRRCMLRNHHAFFGRDDSISSKGCHPAFSVAPTDNRHPTLCYDRRPTPLLQHLSHSHRKSSAGNSVVGWSLAALLGMNRVGGKKHDIVVPTSTIFTFWRKMMLLTHKSSNKSSGTTG